MGAVDFSKPVVTTRDRRPVRILCTDAKGDFPIVGLIERGGFEFLHCWTADGFAPTDDNYTLVNLPEKRTRWLNIYPTLDGRGHCGRFHATRAEADANAGTDRVDCIEVTYTVGGTP